MSGSAHPKLGGRYQGQFPQNHLNPSVPAGPSPEWGSESSQEDDIPLEGRRIRRFRSSGDAQARPRPHPGPLFASRPRGGAARGCVAVEPWRPRASLSAAAPWASSSGSCSFNAASTRPGRAGWHHPHPPGTLRGAAARTQG